jgi:hypothetical protein
VITKPIANLKTIIEAMHPQSTGIIAGGSLAVNGSDPTKFDLLAGFGVIVNHESNPSRPTIIPVAWSDTFGITDPNLTTSLTTYVAIDESGNFVFSENEFTAIQRRNLIVLGWNDHTDMTEIFVSRSEPFYACGAVSQFDDFLEAFGSFNVDGNNYYPAIGLTIRRTAGSVFDGNANYDNEKRNPHVVTTNLENPVAELTYYQRDGAGGWIDDNAPVSVIDPNHWDNDLPTLQVVPTGKFTIQLISFYAPYESNDIQYGQKLYDTLAQAESALRDAVAIDPFNFWDVFRAWLIIKQGTTDLTNSADAKLIPAGKLGMVDVSSGGGAGGEINTASADGLTGIGIVLPKSGINLPFKNISAGSSKVSVVNDATNKAVKIDVVPSNFPAASPAAHAASHFPYASDELPLVLYQVRKEPKTLSGHVGDFFPVEDLGIACRRGRFYKFTFYFRIRADDVTAGLQFQFEAMDGELSAVVSYPLRTTSETQIPLADFRTPIDFRSSAFDRHFVNLLRVEGIVLCNSDGPLIPSIGCFTEGIVITIEKGSIVEYREYDA